MCSIQDLLLSVVYSDFHKKLNTTYKMIPDLIYYVHVDNYTYSSIKLQFISQ